MPIQNIDTTMPAAPGGLIPDLFRLIGTMSGASTPKPIAGSSEDGGMPQYQSGFFDRMAGSPATRLNMARQVSDQNYADQQAQAGRIQNQYNANENANVIPYAMKQAEIPVATTALQKQNEDLTSSGAKGALPQADWKTKLAKTGADLEKAGADSVGYMNEHLKQAYQMPGIVSTAGSIGNTVANNNRAAESTSTANAALSGHMATQPVLDTQMQVGDNKLSNEAVNTQAQLAQSRALLAGQTEAWRGLTTAMPLAFQQSELNQKQFGTPVTTQVGASTLFTGNGMTITPDSRPGQPPGIRQSMVPTSDLMRMKAESAAKMGQDATPNQVAPSMPIPQSTADQISSIIRALVPPPAAIPKPAGRWTDQYIPENRNYMH